MEANSTNFRLVENLETRSHFVEVGEPGSAKEKFILVPALNTFGSYEPKALVLKNAAVQRRESRLICSWIPIVTQFSWCANT